MTQNKQSFLTKEYRQELHYLIEKYVHAIGINRSATEGYSPFYVEWANSNLSDAEHNLQMFLDVATEK
jgi:hypothetical protein